MRAIFQLKLYQSSKKIELREATTIEHFLEIIWIIETSNKMQQKGCGVTESAVVFE
jgi:hypothetical protein